MNYKQAELFLIEHCHAHVEKSELQAMMKRIAEHLTKKSFLELRLDSTVELDESQFIPIVEDLKRERPLQYILGYEWFGHLKLNVNEHVLIPRPETEELVHWVLEEVRLQQQNQSCTILDIGTGSGCIPIWLKSKDNQIEVTAIDISKEALAQATQNAQIHQVDIQFVQADILQSDLNLNTLFDIIISNPPYITSDERSEMASNVLDYEPSLALFVHNDDPLQFYKAIHRFSQSHLAPNGLMFFEVGKQHACSVASYFKHEGLQTELRKDMYGNERMLKVW